MVTIRQRRTTMNTKSAKPQNLKRAPSTNGKPRKYLDSICRRLSKVPGVDAVYAWRDGHKVVHVTSVVKELREALYDKLIPQEERVEKDHPNIAFDFHVRARQNRSVESA